MKKYYLIIIILAIVTKLYSQNNTDVKVAFKNISDTSLYLGYYYGNKTYIIDTTKINNGIAEFVINKKLPTGIYFIALPNFKYFEIILDKNQKFTVKVDNIDKIEKISFENSEENKNFYKFKINISQLFVKSNMLVGRLQANINNNDSVYKIQSYINKFNNSIRKYKLSVVEQNKGTYLAEMVYSMIEPDMNEFNKLPQNTNMKIQNNQRYQFYKNNYFNNYDFANPSLLRSQILENKLQLFFNKVIKHNPDSIINEINKLLLKSESNISTYKFVFDWLLKYYSDYSNKLGYDKVFVYLVDNYIVTNKINWIKESEKNNYISETKKLKPTLIGKIAPELKLANKNDSIISLLKTYSDVSIVIFWSINDVQSIKLINDVNNIVKKFPKKDILIYTVCVNSNINDWKKSKLIENKKNINVCDRNNEVENNGYFLPKVPRIIILDFEKKILTNNANISNVEQILNIIK